VGSFRQKMIEMVGKNGVWEWPEGFWRAGGGFVSFLRDVAAQRSVVRVLRGWRMVAMIEDGGSKIERRRGMGAGGARHGG